MHQETKLTKGIRRVQATIASLSGLLLMFGLVTASWNLLTKDWLFSTVPALQNLWALFQSLAVDANLPVVFLALFLAVQNKARVHIAVYSIVGALLLFVAAMITDAESIRQAENITLEAAVQQLPFHVSLGLLTQLRSWVVVLLVAFNMEAIMPFVRERKAAPTEEPSKPQAEVEPKHRSKPPRQIIPTNGHGGSNQQRVWEFFAVNKGATIQQAMTALSLSKSTVVRYRKAVVRHDEPEPIAVEV